MSEKKWLFLVLLIAFALRTWNVNWDSGYHFHPDERWIVMVTEKIKWVNPITDWDRFNSVNSPMNPDFFAYGSMPLYLLRWVSGGAAEWLNRPELARYGEINLVGRVLSALFDTGTVFLTFLLAKKLINITNIKYQVSSKVQNNKITNEQQNEKTKYRNDETTKYALWAAAFYAVSVFPIQLSHFFTVDTVLTFWVTLGIYVAVRIVTPPSLPLIRGGILLGMVLGAAVATKVSGVFLGVPVGVAILVRVFWGKVPHQVEISYNFKSVRDDKADLKSLSVLSIVARLIFWSLLVAVVAGVTFVVLEPYAVIDMKTFIRNHQEQAAMTKDAWVFPYTRQYLGTIPYVYFIEQYVRFGVGWGLGIAGLVGIVFSIWYLVLSIISKFKIRRSLLIVKGQMLNVDSRALLILLSFVVGYFGYVGGSSVKFMRYLLPLYPIMAVFGVLGIIGFSRIVADYHGSRRQVSTILFWVVLVMTGVWTVGFVGTVYSQENTRIQASRWMSESLVRVQTPPSPPLARGGERGGDPLAGGGITLGVEHWDDGMPVPPWNVGFEHVELPLYEFDSEQKWRTMAGKLEEVDAIVLASNRLSSPLQRIGKYDQRYEVTRRYYELLFSGKLGFVEVADYHVMPGLGPWRVDTQKADESFQVYDHPRVRVFVKREIKLSEDYFSLLWRDL